MIKIRNFLTNNTPFAVMQYFESFKGSKRETQRVYELMYLNDKKKLEFQVLDRKQTTLFKSNKDKMVLKVQNNYGCVYEFNDFKAYQKKNIRD